ncbi:MAG: BamA/TamA family outer membrane protein [Calditrichaeota bacterium]|nr:BamA/TamA family outer membrane protein [Calditrichota bacterium]
MALGSQRVEVGKKSVAGQGTGLSRRARIRLLLRFVFWSGLLVVLWAGISSRALGQRVVAERVEGNRRTKPWVILRELKTQVGDSVTPSDLQEDRDRVLNLGLFERAELTLHPGPSGDTLVVRVWERWYIFPFPILFANEHDLRKLSYGLGLAHFNFRGRAEILSVVGWLGYNPALRFSYSNPWFGGKHRFLGSLEVFWASIRGKSLEFPEYHEKQRGVKIRFGKRFSYGTYIVGLAGYTFRRTEPPDLGVTIDPGGRDAFGTLGLLAIFDGRDFRPYPWRGYYLETSLKQNGFGSPVVDYTRLVVDARTYLPLPVGSLGFRLVTKLSRGRVPVYDRVYIGYEERVRGHFSKRLEGDNMGLGSAEWKMTLLPLRYWPAPSYLPLTTALKFGLNASVFYDVAAVWRDGQAARSGTWLHGFGLGLHVRVPYAEVVRLEAAFDEDGRPEFILDVGKSF